MIKLKFKTRGKIITRYEVFSNGMCFISHLYQCNDEGKNIYVLIHVLVGIETTHFTILYFCEKVKN